MTAGLLAALCLAASPARAAAPAWRLAWSDEFAGPAGAPPDPAKWRFDVGRGGDGWGNRELEYYCGRPADGPCDPRRPNVYQDGRGNLVIEARRSSGTWTSGRLESSGLSEFEFGRVEARMKLPRGAGLWPAFWLLGADVAKAEWPACGEIDVMENVPALGPGRIKATVHGPGYSGAGGVGQDFVFTRGRRVDDGFHTYGVIWSPDRLAFYVDDWRTPFLRVTPATLPKGTAWVYDKPFFLLLNLAVGGSWPGAPDASTPEPARALVDWVRVYELPHEPPRRPAP